MCRHLLTLWVSFLNEPMGCLHYSFSIVAPHVMSTLVSNVMAATEVLAMVKLVNEAFQCLGVFNLDLHGIYDQVFGLLCL